MALLGTIVYAVFCVGVVVTVVSGAWDFIKKHLDGEELDGLAGFIAYSVYFVALCLLFWGADTSKLHIVWLAIGGTLIFGSAASLMTSMVRKRRSGLTYREVAGQRGELRQRWKEVFQQWDDYRDRYPDYKPADYWDQQRYYHARQSDVSRQMEKLPGTIRDNLLDALRAIGGTAATGLLVWWFFGR